jgi:eukaryotic-like serine/threonine-protein kinase
VRPLEPAARANVLHEACGEDIPLREQVLLLLQASEQEGGDELEARYERAIAANLRASEASPGTIIGRYRVVRLLGTGGMGTVYLAERADEQYQQLAALKVVARGLLHADTANRFRSERQILARLNHVNIARLLDGGHTDDGTPYLVMEYVEGVRIDHYCTERGMTTGARLRLFQQVCAAVQYAHQNLVVHRDLKPSNILVTNEGLPKLLDFGIAKLRDPHSLDTERTRLRDRVLTPEYASPEQLRGDAIGTESDIHTLGTLLYELLTGRRLYGDMKRSSAELERMICQQDPPPPSTRVRPDDPRPGGARGVQRELTGDLDNIVLKAMHREPARRYASAAALAQDIQNFLDARPVQARPDSVLYRTQKFVQRNAWGVAMGVGVVALIAGLTIFYTTRLAAERDRAALEAAKARQVSGFLSSLFERTNPWGVGGKDVTALELLDRGASDVEHELAKEPVILSDLLLSIGDSYKILGAYDRAGPILERAVALKEKAGLAHSVEYANAVYELANLYRFEGRFAPAEQCFMRALAVQRRLFPDGSPETADSLSHLGTLYGEMGRWDDALKMHNEALPMTLETRGVNSEDAADRMNNFALALQGAGQYARAADMFKQAMAIQKRVLAPLHPDALGTRYNYAALLNAMGQYEQAEHNIRELMPARRAVLGKHPRLGYTLITYGRALTALGKYDEARDALDEALDIFTNALGPEHYRTGQAYRSIGLLALARGNFQAAERSFRRDEHIEAVEFGESSDNVFRTRSLIAAALLRQGRTADAQPLLEQSYAKLYGAGRRPAAEYDRTLLELASLRMKQARLPEAELLYRQVLQKYAGFGIANHPDTAEALRGLAEIAQEREQPLQAAAFSQRALETAAPHVH